jgi:predicted Zn-dependent protease
MTRRIFAAIALLLAAAACATNPVSGRREFNIVSEQQEIALGTQAHQQVLQQFGVYDEKPELNQLVNRIGQRVAAVSDRSGLKWTFTLLDAPMVNAMALPGGYVYVTRGILERMNSEDELAGVIAHEVAHVAARHSAQQISQTQLAQLGLVIGSIAAGPRATQAYGGLAQLGLGLLFQRYSRQQETESDLLGTAYMTEAGYNPEGAAEMLVALDRLDKDGPSGIERYFMDHPDPVKRVADVRKQIATMRASSSAIGQQPLERTAFVRRLDGIVTGNSTLRTVIRANAVYDRTNGIIMPVPSGWEAAAQPGTIFVMTSKDAKGAGLIVQEVPLAQISGTSLSDAVRRNLSEKGLRYLGSRNASTRTGERFTVDVWTGQTQQGSVGVESTQVTAGNQAIIMMFVAPGASGDKSPLSNAIASMRVDRAEAKKAEPPRMRVSTLRGGDSWSAVASKATGNPNDAEAVAAINGFDVRTPLPQGTLVKLPQQIAE